MSVSSRKQFTLRIVAKGDSEKLAMADLFDELKVVSVEYHLMGMKGLDDELRRREKELDRMQAELKTAPRCSKLGVIKAMVDLIRPKGISSHQVSLMDLKKAIDAIW